MFKVPIPIRLHCWGGLGSQLFTWAIFLDLEKIHVGRKIKIYFHSSGITRRMPESITFAENQNVYFKDDYSVKTRSTINLDSRNNLVSHLFKKIFAWLGFYSAANTSNEFDQLKFNIIEIRGHYSRREISKYSLSMILKKISLDMANNPINIDSGESLMIQYRLGDLLNYGEKTYVKPDTITKLLSELAEVWPTKKIHVYSDSPDTAMKFLRDSRIHFEFVDTSPIAVIQHALLFKYFIGTTSKISMWIVLLRLFADSNSYNSLPIELMNDFNLLQPNCINYPNFFYY